MARSTTTPKRARKKPTNTGPYKCPECEKLGTERRFTTPQARGRHRQAMHGVEGTSAVSIAKRNRTTNAKTDATNNHPKRTRKVRSTRRTRRQHSRRAPATLNGALDHNKLLNLIFPNGIPAKASLLSDVQDLISQAERLHREAQNVK